MYFCSKRNENYIIMAESDLIKVSGKPKYFHGIELMTDKVKREYADKRIPTQYFQAYPYYSVYTIYYKSFVNVFGKIQFKDINGAKAAIKLFREDENIRNEVKKANVNITKDCQMFVVEFQEYSAKIIYIE